MIFCVFPSAYTLNWQPGGVGSLPCGLAVVRVNKCCNDQNCCQSTKNVIKRRFLTTAVVFLTVNNLTATNETNTLNTS